MAKEGVTGVLNVQTVIDFEHRGINWDKMLQYYEENGIRAEHFPIHDFNAEDLKIKLLDGAKLLAEMILTDGRQVYVHCTAGMGRAPAVVLVYLCLYQGMDPDEADRFVKTQRSVSVPNLTVVREVVARNKPASTP